MIMGLESWAYFAMLGCDYDCCGRHLIFDLPQNKRSASHHASHVSFPLQKQRNQRDGQFAAALSRYSREVGSHVDVLNPPPHPPTKYMYPDPRVPEIR